MLIALDYDECYTVDPEFWDLMIALAKHRGHSVICVTMRYKHEGEVIINTLEEKVERIIFTGRKAKHQFTQDMGYYPSVWIDDNPRWLYTDAS